MDIRNGHVVRLCRADKCLYLNVDESLYCFSPWSMGLECSSLVGDQWQPWRHDSGFRLLHDEVRKPAAVHPRYEFIDQIPVEVRAKARQFQHLQHTVLRLMCCTEYALDLADSNPVLLWLIASGFASRDIAIRQAVKLIKGKQAVALRTLYPENEALSVGFTKRVYTKEFSVAEFNVLEHILSEEACVKCLLHCKRVNLKVLTKLDCYPFILELPPVKRLIEKERCCLRFSEQIQRVVSEGLDHAVQIEHGDPWEAMSRCKTFVQLCDLTDRWYGERILIVTEDDFGEFLPASSLFGIYTPIAPGTETIEPVTGLVGLFIEGEDMDNCIFNYSEIVKESEVTIYRVLFPQRGTLLLCSDSDGYTIEEFKLANNDEPSEESWNAVRFWAKYLNQNVAKGQKTALPSPPQERLPAG